MYWKHSVKEHWIVTISWSIISMALGLAIHARNKWYNLLKILCTHQQLDPISLDFPKAFNRVSHRWLLQNLHYYEINGKTHKWIEAWLMQKSQQVLLDGDFSPFISIKSGVPQGTVLACSCFYYTLIISLRTSHYHYICWWLSVK